MYGIVGQRFVHNTHFQRPVACVAFLLSVSVVRHISILFLLLIFTCWHAETLGQRIGSRILNDSSRLEYGPSTTQHILEKDIIWGNTEHYQPIDTSVLNYHHWTYIQRFHNFYKNLANVGTALYPIFPTLPHTIGVSTGFDAYNPYFDTQTPTYFNTRSPYTRLRIVWAGYGRSLSTIRFSRNITPRWNVGFSFRPILVDKQIQRAHKGDRQTASYYYDAHMSYATKNNRYKVFFNYRHINHLVHENGGIIQDPQAVDPYKALFNRGVQPKLNTATSEEVHNSAQLLQQYTLIANRLNIYYHTDAHEEINTYRDTDIERAPQDFYDQASPLGKKDKAIEDKTSFLYWVHKVGVQGRVGHFFHDAYFKVRLYQFDYKYLKGDTLSIPLSGEEYYFGGHVSYDYDSLFRIAGWADILLDNNYNMSMSLTSKWVDAKVSQVLAKPSFIYNSYRGTFDFWNNNFKQRGVTRVELFAKVGVLKKRFITSVGATYTVLNNYIYFKKGAFSDGQTVLPFQLDGEQALLTPEVRLSITFLKHFTLRSQLLYSQLFGNKEVIRVPKLFLNTQFSYENTFFNGNLHLQAGVEVHWKSDYFDLGYDPVIQQFYLQDETITPSFFLTDVFLNGKIRKGRFFFRYHNLVQAFTQSGYLSTPGYPGQRNILDFGCEIFLFD